MWRNFGWTAILAIWTIFLILNSGLAGERTSSNPRIDDKRTFHEIHERATFPVFNESAVSDSALQYTKDISKTDDHTSVYRRPVSLELKNTKTRNFNVSERDIVMSNAMAMAKHVKSGNVRKTWLTVGRVTTGNVWLSKIIILKMPKDMRYRHKFTSGLRTSSLLRELKDAARKRKHKDRTIYEFSNGRKKPAVIGDDTRAFDEESEWWKRRDNGKIFSRRNSATAFFHGEFSKRPQDRRDGSTREFENSVIPNFGTPLDAKSRNTREIRECNKSQEDSLQSLELSKNNANKSIYIESNDASLTSTTTPNSHSQETQSCKNVETVAGVTSDTITESSADRRTVTAAWTALIHNSKISNINGAVHDEENGISSRRNLERNGYSNSDKERAAPKIEIYKRRKGEHSKIGFKVKTVPHENSKKWNEDIESSFTFRTSHLSNDYLARNRISFAERSLPQMEKNSLRTARNTPGSRREYHSSTYDVGTKTDEKMERLGKLRSRKRAETKGITVDAMHHTPGAVQNDPSFVNFSAVEIVDSKLDPAMSPRISVTRQRNPMHVRHVKTGTGYEKRRTTEVHAVARVALWNVSGSSRTAQFRSSAEDKPQSRFRYLQKLGGLDIESRWSPRFLKTIDSRMKLRREPQGISTEGRSISFAATTIAGNSNEMRKINEFTLSSSGSANERGLSSAEVATNRGKSRDVAREEFNARSRGNRIQNLTYRRYKRHEVRSALESSTLAEIKTGDVLDTITGPSRSGIKLTEDPFVSASQTVNTPRTSTGAEESLITATTPASSVYQEFRQELGSLPPIDTDYEGYTSTSAKIDSDSLEVPFVVVPETSNVSEMKTPAPLIRMLDRSTMKSEIDNFVSPKGTPSDTEATRATEDTSKNTLDISSVESTDMQKGRRAHANGSFTIIDLLPQRSSDLARDAFENVTTENADDLSNDTTLLHQWPVKHSAVVEGDLVLGGLMMVHEREDTITCGPVMPQGGVQALEAMLYTLDYINKNDIVPGVKIGAHILDDCDKDTYGLEMAVDFIKGSISNIDGAEYHCNKTAVRKVISGVVGAASSVTSIQVANLLRLFRIPQVSFFSTSPELSNKQRFEYFTRTIPSDHYQVKAMVDIVLKMSWSYVSIIYEESNYGIKAFEELEELLGKYNICIAVKEKLVKDSGVAEETAYDNIVSKLLTKPRAKGCIIFGSDQEVAGVMRAVRRCNATGTFSWIGSDGWSARGLVSNGNEPEVEGTLSVQPQANSVQDFEEYFLNLTVENNRRNPWFVEFWEDHFKCRYPNASWTPYNKNYTKTCTTKERLTKQDTDFEDQLQFVSDAVMAFGYAFRDMHRDLCQSVPGLCESMKPINGTKLLQYLRKVEFEGLSGDRFRFDKNGDGPARYNIIHFKQIEPGNYKWVRVGKYLEGELRLNMSEIQFKLGHPQPPESVCSSPCKVGQIKKYVEGERCCWHCFNCAQYEIRDPEDETQCKLCPNGTLPDENHSICRNIPEEFLRPESGWAIGAMSFSASGILVTSFVCGVFLKHNDTPVVRASGRELSYVLLAGILLCYLVTFTLVLRPTDIVCGIQRFAAGLCFAIVYAALLTKTNRIARIFNDGRQSAKRPSFISPRSQLTICFGLVFVQILINGVWMMIDPARAMPHYPTKKDNLLVCNSYVDASYMIAFAYPIILIAVCTVYAVLTRKIPEAFNESKHIGFAMYTTCVIWLAFVPLYFGTETNVTLRITSMSVTISLSAYVMVFLLFGPKLYIILIRPERNVRPNIKAGRPNLTKSSAITATNPSMVGPVTATAVLTAVTCDQNKAIKKHITSTIDCSTQSEYYEMEVKEQKNGRPLATCASRSTQTINEKESTTTVIVTSNKESPDVVVSAGSKESKNNATVTKRLNSNARIGNGPSSQNDVAL